MRTTKNRFGYIVKVGFTPFALVMLAMNLVGIFAILDDASGRTMGANDSIKPSNAAQEFIALSHIEQFV